MEIFWKCMSHIYIDLVNSKFTFFSFSYKEQWTLKTKKMAYYLNFLFSFISCSWWNTLQTATVVITVELLRLAMWLSSIPLVILHVYSCIFLYCGHYMTFSHFYFLNVYLFINVEPRRGYWIPCNWIYTWQWASSRCWDSSSGPLEELSKVSTTNLPSHLEIVIYSQFYNRFM